MRISSLDENLLHEIMENSSLDTMMLASKALAQLPQSGEITPAREAATLKETARDIDAKPFIRIKCARVLTGLSCAKAAEAIGIPRRTLENFEYGVRTPDTFKLSGIIQELLSLYAKMEKEQG